MDTWYRVPMKVSLKNYLVPYELDGSLMPSMPYQVEPGETTYTRAVYDPNLPYNHPQYRTTMVEQYPVIWLPNDPFTLRLTILSEEDHRRLKAKTVWWKADDGRKFPMFANNLASTLLANDLVKGRTGSVEWVVRKHGREFGILPYDKG